MQLNVDWELKVNAEYHHPWLVGPIADLSPEDKRRLDERLREIGEELSEVVETYLRGKYSGDTSKSPMYYVEVAYPVHYYAKDAV